MTPSAAPSGRPDAFRIEPWVWSVLPMTGIVTRLSLIAAAAIFSHRNGDRPVTAAEVGELTRLAPDVVADVLDEAVTAGLMTSSRRGFTPTQDLDPMSAEQIAQLELERAEDCGACLAAATQPCRTNGGLTAWTSHSGRRKYAQRVMQAQLQIPA